MAYTTLSKGDGYITGKGLTAEVKKAQQALVTAGYLVDIDGRFGAATQRAVIEFQKKNNLSPDGIIGKATWAVLSQYLPATTSPQPTTSTKTMIDVVIDISHHNGNVNLSTVRDSGIVGVIAKATQGTGFRDPKFKDFHQKAQEAGLLRGAYHFGTGDNVERQVENFLLTTRPDVNPATLLVLDLENNPAGKTMSLFQAEQFCAMVHQKTGKWPGLYSGNSIKEYLASARETPLANCWLWLAQYGPKAVIPKQWDHWTLWQYTEQGVVPGISGKVDRNRFMGTEEELRNWWGQG